MFDQTLTILSPNPDLCLQRVIYHYDNYE